jgi:hypothetical protein
MRSAFDAASDRAFGEPQRGSYWDVADAAAKCPVVMSRFNAFGITKMLTGSEAAARPQSTTAHEKASSCSIS